MICSPDGAKRNPGVSICEGTCPDVASFGTHAQGKVMSEKGNKFAL